MFLSFRFPLQNSIFIFLSIRATCPAHPVLLYLMCIANDVDLPHYAVLSSILSAPPSYAKISPSAPYSRKPSACSLTLLGHCHTHTHTHTHTRTHAHTHTHTFDTNMCDPDDGCRAAIAYVALCNVCSVYMGGWGGEADVQTVRSRRC